MTEFGQACKSLCVKIEEALVRVDKYLTAYID